MSIRDVLPSSKLQSVLLSTCAYRIHIGNLKALLKELGFNWNGPSCSVQELLRKLKEYVNPDVTGYQPRIDQYQTAELKKTIAIIPAEQNTLMGLKKKEGAHTLIEIVRE